MNKHVVNTSQKKENRGPDLVTAEVIIVRGKYRDVILPMTVIRHLGAGG